MQEPTTKAYNFVRDVMTSHFPGHVSAFLPEVFLQVENSFAGHYPGYQRSDTLYHDLAHTHEAAVAVARILDGHITSGALPKITAREFELGIVAALLHDSGYFKEVGDNEGTGAKYTVTHVARSAKFAEKFLTPLGLSAEEVRLVKMMIHSTGIDADVRKLNFRCERDRFLAGAVGTGDMLGQMAAPDYPKRLPFLYREYVEAAKYSKITEGGIAGYQSAEDLLRRTRGFYAERVQHMLENQWGGVHRALLHHFPSGENEYFNAINANLDRIDALLSATVH